MENLIKRVEQLEKLISVTQKDVLNIDELHLLTGISKSSIYKSTMNGTIPHYKQSKHLFFDRLEINEWLKETKGA